MATDSKTSDHDDDEKPEAAEGVDGETAEDAALHGEADEEAPQVVATPKKSATKSGAKRARRAAPPPPKKGSLGTSMVLFVIVVGGLAAGFAFLGKETGGGSGPSAPKWKTGQDVDVELTLVSTDRQDLACAFADEVAGRHCAFETQTKAWSKSSNEDDKALLKPYTTTDGVQFTAAGVWSEPALSGKLPATRFAVKCKYKVEGKLAKPGIRWSSDGPWYPQTAEWYAGSVSGCTVTP